MKASVEPLDGSGDLIVQRRGEIIAALRDGLAYACLMSHHLDFALRFLPE
ncbi:MULTISPECIES: hypothetical protein [unclassified Mesorhizobium]|nr:MULTISPECIES: hypothetical protein [unclassified Mesorhizobium]